MALSIMWSVFALLFCVGLLVLFLVVNRKAPDGVLRPLISAAQQMMVIMLFPVDWPDSIKALGTVFSGISLDFVNLMSPACLGVPLNFYWRYGLLVLGTTFVLGMPWLVSYLRHRNNAEKWEGAVKARIRDTFLLVLLFHPTVSGQTFYHFRCQPVGNTSYLMVDYTLECYDTTWIAMLGLVVPVTLFFSVGLPLLFAWLLYRRRDVLQEDGTKKLLGVIYKAYKPELYWFESVTMLFKLLLWATLVFFDDGSQFQLATAALVGFCQVGVHAKFEPFVDPFKNWLQYVGLVLVALVSFSGLILNFLEVSKDYALVQDDQYNLKSLREQIAAFKMALAVVTWTGLALVLFRVLLKAYKFMKKNGSRVSRAGAAVGSVLRRGMQRNRSSGEAVAVELPVVGGGNTESAQPRTWSMNPAEGLGLEPGTGEESNNAIEIEGRSGNGQQMEELQTNPMQTGESGNHQGSFIRSHSRTDRLERMKSTDAPGGSTVAEKAREEQGGAKDDTRKQMGSFIAKGDGSFIAQEGRSGRRHTSKKKSGASARRPLDTACSTTTTKTSKATSSVAPFASGVDSSGIKRGTDAAVAGGGGGGGGGGFGDGGGGSGGGGVIISEGVESKRPELMIGQGDNESNHTGPADGRHEVVAVQGLSRFDSADV
jgi:uncharacterized membrane protein YgcG